MYNYTAAIKQPPPRVTTLRRGWLVTVSSAEALSNQLSRVGITPGGAAGRGVPSNALAVTKANGGALMALLALPRRSYDL